MRQACRKIVRTQCDGLIEILAGLLIFTASEVCPSQVETRDKILRARSHHRLQFRHRLVDLALIQHEGGLQTARFRILRVVFQNLVVFGVSLRELALADQSLNLMLQIYGLSRRIRLDASFVLLLGVVKLRHPLVEIPSLDVRVGKVFQVFLHRAEQIHQLNPFVRAVEELR